ncbi:MAG: indole-3-glycerol-phosphate synthase, partial [Acidimicrobiales bacterium]
MTDRAGTYLDAILDHHRRRATADQRDLPALIEHARALEPPRGFRSALFGSERLAVVSEIKRRSPSRGNLSVALGPARLARQYAQGGATCLSVLTDRTHFGGSADDLRVARNAVDLPVLRKDFTVALRDVCDTRLMGADCVLLIVAALDDAELRDFHALATELGLDALVEVHDESEIERALSAGATLIGVNQRDLVTFEVDQKRAVRVASSLPSAVLGVAGSGGRDRAVALAMS